GSVRDHHRLLESLKQATFDIIKDARHGGLLLFLVCTVSPHPVLAIVVDNEIQFFVGEAVVFGKYTIYLPNGCETQPRIELIILDSPSYFRNDRFSLCILLVFIIVLLC